MRALPLFLTTCSFLLLFIYLLTAYPHVQAQSHAPALTIATGIQASAGSTVTVAVDFRNYGRAISGLAFAVVVDATCLRFDPSDHNGDRQPDAVTFRLPTQLRGSANYNVTTGELNVVVADYAPPLATIPDTDGLVQLIFTAVCTPATGQTMVIPVKFSITPSASFSDPQGKSVSGITTGGTVVINPPGAPPLPTPAPTPTGTLPTGTAANTDLLLTAQAAIATARAGDIITYTYLLTNTGKISLTVAAVDDRLGAVLWRNSPTSTDSLSITHLLPGETAWGAHHYAVQPCDAAGPLVNTVTVTGTTPSGVVFTLLASTSVNLEPESELAPLIAAADTIYTGCTIRLSITPATRALRSYQMVVVAGPPPADLVLSGVQAIYPYANFRSMVEKTNTLVTANCIDHAPCNAVTRTFFSYGNGYWTETIAARQGVTDFFFPFVAMRCVRGSVGC